MRYGYFLTKVFKHLDIPLKARTIGTVKQSFSMITLVEFECMEGRTWNLSKMSELVVKQGQLKHELEEMNSLVSKRDAKIALLKEQSAKAQTEGPGSAEVSELRKKNETLLAQNADMKEKLIKYHDASNDRPTLVIQSFTQKPLSS
ncbi:hypothetical protein KY284_008009 [Solanum tuberosum]|nr:hypothetical protein KY284_008009 [Solanum tuberosum]